MPELAVAVVARDSEQRNILQLLVEGTRVARAVLSFGSLPLSSTDPIVRRLQEEHPDVVVLDIPLNDAPSALRSIEVLHQELPRTALFAVGSLTQPQTIVTAMRSGAREFLERPLTTNMLLEAFVRLSATQNSAQRNGVRGKVFAIVNAKGGCGATTIAVNLALALQAAHGQAALVDLAPLGHAALHLNLRPSFTAYDAAYFHFVVVDMSNRMDAIARLVCDLSQTVLVVAGTDVASLWSAARIQQFLGENNGRDRLRLVLNRFRKIQGFQESEAESASGLALLWKVPNHYPAVSGAIDRGVPLMQQNRSELTRAFTGLAEKLTETEAAAKRPTWSLFKIG